MRIDAASPPQGTVRSWLDARAKAGGVAIHFPETGEDLSWDELRRDAADWARQLTAMGAGPSESIAIMHPNGREGVTALYAALYGGFRATMINLAAGQEAIAYALEHSEARFAFVHADQMATFNAAKPDHLTALGSLDRTHTAPPHPIGADDHALLMYTSGTTGRPKGVIHTHASLLAGGWTTAVAHELGAQDRGFCVLPIYHINGLCVTVMGALVSGGSLAMVSKFSARAFWGQAQSSAVTWFSVVPTIISHLVHSDTSPEPAKLQVRFGRSASSALAVETQQAFENRFNIPIVETMGLTETAAQILSNPLPPGPRKIGSPGMAYGCEVAIHDTAGVECARETEGEIVVRGPNLLREYFKNPEATEATFRDGWLRTGDLARMDAEGYVFVTGRLKELIIKGGENIAPREIDEALYAHPDVVEAAAFARPCGVYGERVEAAVRISDGATLDQAELLRMCHDRLGKFKSPDCIHFLDDLPKGPSGKIQRLKLAELIPA